VFQKVDKFTEINAFMQGDFWHAGPVFRDRFPGMQLVEDSLGKSSLHKSLGV
jgi:hypothetical protein